jgi:hypothetical protein
MMLTDDLASLGYPQDAGTDDRSDLKGPKEQR